MNGLADFQVGDIVRVVRPHEVPLWCVMSEPDTSGVWLRCVHPRGFDIPLDHELWHSWRSDMELERVSPDVLDDPNGRTW